jgi:CheY-like chemotaxis protein
MDLSTSVEGRTNLRVLVIDDQQDTAETLAILMRHEGHKVRTCCKSIESAEIAKLEQPDVVLLDIGMPKMDGYAVVRRLREQRETAHACIVAVTGHSLPADKERIKVAGFDAHIVKPYDVRDILDTIGRVRESSH